jgi:hypothetical protein
MLTCLLIGLNSETDRIAQGELKCGISDASTASLALGGRSQLSRQTRLYPEIARLHLKEEVCELQIVSLNAKLFKVTDL